MSGAQPTEERETGAEFRPPTVGFAALAAAAARGFARPRFRGGVLGTIAKVPMGKGHGNAGKPFDPDSACNLKPIWAEYDKARANGTPLKLVLLAGVKTMKSFVGESCTVDHVCHALGDFAMFFATGEVADTGATTRILDNYRLNPFFAVKLQSITSRFDETKGAVKFPEKTLFILAANMSNAQQKNLAGYTLQDAFLTEATGMIEELEARTTQYQHSAIRIIESQGGETGYDFDRHYNGTDQRELHVNCPCCGTRHIWNWKAWDMTRADDFQAVLPRAKVEEINHRWTQMDTDREKELAAGVSNSPDSASEIRVHPCPSVVSSFRNPNLDLELEAARVELTTLLKSENRRRCGFKRGEDELIKFADGSYNESAILRETHFECYHCGGIWRDDCNGTDFHCPTRIALDESSHYIAANPNALPTNVGFNFPQWINRRLPWGKMMLEKLSAQKVADELGNFEPLKKWWQKVAARTWDKNVGRKTSARIQGSQYDDKAHLPGEKVRISATDCQFNLTWMCYQAWAVGDGTGPRLLHRELVLPPISEVTDEAKREWCKNRVRALDKEFGIEQQNSMKDCAHRPDLVREWAAQDAAVFEIQRGWIREKKMFTYGLLIGDEKLSFRWKHPGRKPTWERFQQDYIETTHKVALDVKDGKGNVIRSKVPMTIRVGARLWSNFSIKEIAVRWRDGDSAPKIIVHEKWLADQSAEGFAKSMVSEVKVPWKNRPGKERYDNQSRPNHDWDCFNMMLVRMDVLGYLNNFSAPEAETEA